MSVCWKVNRNSEFCLSKYLGASWTFSYRYPNNSLATTTTPHTAPVHWFILYSSVLYKTVSCGKPSMVLHWTCRSITSVCPSTLPFVDDLFHQHRNSRRVLWGWSQIICANDSCPGQSHLVTLTSVTHSSVVTSEFSNRSAAEGKPRRSSPNTLLHSGLATLLSEVMLK